MSIFITVGILLITALVLLSIRFASPDFRYTWLTAAGGAFISWLSIFFWQASMPLLVDLPLWQPESIFRQSPLFVADGISWAFSLSIVSVSLAVIVTAVARDNFPSPVSWIGILMLAAFGVLASTADNPLTLVLIWAAIDLTELVTQIRFVEDPNRSERIVISFASRMAGTLILLWASMVSASSGLTLDFLSAPPRAGLFLILAAGFRLGVLPLHLPYVSESAFRRGFGTALRMVSAGSSLILLARVPLGGADSTLTPFLMLFTSFAALFGAWNWLRSPDELSGRPFWLIGMGGLAVAAALRGNPIGATAWSCALILSGGALFLASAQSRWVERSLWVGVWGASALPFSLTATGWVNETSGLWFALPLLLIAQSLLLAGFIRQIQRAAVRTTFENQPIWAKNVYPTGTLVIFLTLLVLGIWGWDGTLKIGNWIASIIASLLTFGLLWLVPRVRLLNPVRAHWVTNRESSASISLTQAIWDSYYAIRRALTTFSNVLEGESGIMWTLLFLALFISMFTRVTP